MEFTGKGGQVFPAGTTVKAYLRTNWAKSEIPPSGAPKGAAVAEAVVADDGSYTFAGLTEKLNYFAAGEVAGVYKYVRFRAAAVDEGEPAGADIAKLNKEINLINQGTDWSDGERLFGFSAQNTVGGQRAEILLGSTAAPDEGNEPTVVIGRVLKTPEALFSGDGAGNLAALRVHTTALAGSQGQAIGIVGSAITLSEYEAGHSLADGIGLYGLGISKGTSTRTGMGLFANGRTETNTGRATGIEVVCDNESELDDEFTGAFPRTKSMHLHAVGLKRVAAGLIVSKSGIGLHSAIVAQKEALISSAFIRDDSSAPWSQRIGGTHSEAAIAVLAGAGSIVIGAEKPALTTTLLEVNGGAETHDPLVNFKVTSGSIRVQVAGPTGQVGIFAAAGTNSFVVGTVAGDSGASFAPGHTFHIGANGKTSMLRLTESGSAVNGATPVARAAAIAVPAETLAGHQAAINSLREAVKNFGITL